MSQSCETRSGSISFPKGRDGILVEFSEPMPSSNYAITVQQTNAGGYSPTSEATYFNVLRKTKNGFQIQHKTTESDTPKKLQSSVTLNWIAVSN